MKQYTYDEFTDFKLEYVMHMSFAKYTVTYYVNSLTGIKLVQRTDRNMRTGRLGKMTYVYLYNCLEFDNVAALYMHYMDEACGGIYD